MKWPALFVSVFISLSGLAQQDHIQVVSSAGGSVNSESFTIGEIFIVTGADSSKTQGTLSIIQYNVK